MSLYEVANASKQGTGLKQTRSEISKHDASKCTHLPSKRVAYQLIEAIRSLPELDTPACIRSTRSPSRHTAIQLTLGLKEFANILKI